MKELIEDYKKELDSVEKRMLKWDKNSVMFWKLASRYDCYFTFIAELEKIEKETNK